MYTVDLFNALLLLVKKIKLKKNIEQNVRV